MKYTINLLDIPYSKVMPIIEWCVSNNIQIEKCVRMLEGWHDREHIRGMWELEFEEAEATLFCLRWASEKNLEPDY